MVEIVKEEPGQSSAGGEPSVSPDALREGVRRGVLDALAEDRDWRGAWAAKRLAAAGVAGVVIAVAMTLLCCGNGLTHEHAYLVAIFGAAWAGLLVECFAFVLLRLRTRALPVVQAAGLGLTGLGFAGVVAFCCPEPHYLDWWASTRPGSWLVTVGGLPTSAFGLGLVSAVFLGLVATLITIWRGGKLSGATIPSMVLSVLLLPGILLQCIGSPMAILTTWSAGTVLGSLGGIMGAMMLSGSRRGSVASSDTA